MAISIGLPAELHRAAWHLVDAEDGARQFGAARADQPREADDFAAPDREADAAPGIGHAC